MNISVIKIYIENMSPRSSPNSPANTLLLNVTLLNDFNS